MIGASGANSSLYVGDTGHIVGNTNGGGSGATVNGNFVIENHGEIVGNAKVAFGPDTIQIDNTTIASLHATDFVFF